MTPPLSNDHKRNLVFRPEIGERSAVLAADITLN
jgi:hypothetical protein